MKIYINSPTVNYFHLNRMVLGITLLRIFLTWLWEQFCLTEKIIFLKSWSDLDVNKKKGVCAR